MKKDLWLERLEIIKRQESPETVLIVAGSVELTRIVVAWKGIKTNRKKKLSACNSIDNQALWCWLWENVVYSEDWFYSRITGCRKKAQQNFEVLVANRVLYPDGTINGYVERYLRGKVLNLFGISKHQDVSAA
ncbi:MAG TPA: hypothetical protein PLI09_01105 [Candidatus Hydrogenedentes bacterium]|nr:hypothetical protein [Candidatus Hydrogenedentota bacterium]